MRNSFNQIVPLLSGSFWAHLKSFVEHSILSEVILGNCPRLKHYLGEDGGRGVEGKGGEWGVEERMREETIT